jgi:UDP-N-acetylglucosamine:LPS N-acetylglucosamine transferase
VRLVCRHSSYRILPQSTDAGAAVIIDESMLSASVLADQLRAWLGSREQLQLKAEKARSLAKPSALQRITELCLQQAGVAA